MSGDKDNNVDAWANEILVEARLQAIEREHKSIGDILDTRTLPQLEDINTKAWRGRKKPQFMIPITTVLDSVQNTKKQSSPIRTENDQEQNDEYHNEEALWKIKSSDPNYALKRSPHDQFYFDKLNNEKKKIFYMNCKRAIQSVAIQLRNEVRKEQMKMDNTKLFHPEVNSHRAQNLYLNRLYSKISCDSIEDPVLHAMMQNDNKAVILKSSTDEFDFLHNSSFSKLNMSNEIKQTALPEGKTLQNIPKFEKFVRTSSLERKPRLPSFESFLQGDELMKYHSQKAKSAESLKTFHLHATLRSNRFLDKKELSMKPDRTHMLLLRETPAGKSIAHRTSRVVEKILKEQEEAAITLTTTATAVHGVNVHNTKLLGASILEDIHDIRKKAGRGRGTGRGYYDGFKRIFAAPVYVGEEEERVETVQDKNYDGLQSQPIHSNSHIPKSMKGIIVDPEQKTAMTLLASPKTRRKSIYKKSTDKEAKDNQTRLAAIWEILRAPTVVRLDFMQKYSSLVHVNNFVNAIDLWAAVSVLMVTRIEILKFIERIQKGFHSDLPTEIVVLEAVEVKIPTALMQMWREIENSKYRPFSSSNLIQDFRILVYNSFEVANQLRHDKLYDEQDSNDILRENIDPRYTPEGFCLHALISINRHLERKMVDLLKIVQEDLDDIVPYGNASCKDWLHNSRAAVARRHSVIL